MSEELRTRESLLLCLKSLSNESAWEQFYTQYKSIILSFSQKHGLDESASHDVLQETMVLLMRKMPQFDYDADRGRFRNWLLTLVAGKIRDAQRRAARHTARSLQDDSGKYLAVFTDQRDAAQSVDWLWMQSVAEEAFRRLQRDPRMKPETLQVFDAYVIKGQPVSEVARAYALEENAIYQIKNRLLRRLKEEVARIDTIT